MRAIDMKVTLHKNFNFDKVSKEAIHLIRPDKEKSKEKERCFKIEYIDKGVEFEPSSVVADYPLKVKVKRCYSYKSDWEIQHLILATKLRFAVKLPCTTDWCDTCHGSGTRSKYDIEGYDIDAMLYEDGVIDEEFAEDYFGGRTDVKCNACNGLKIQNVVDYDACNELQMQIVNENSRLIQEEYEDMRNAESVRRAENGWAY